MWLAHTLATRSHPYCFTARSSTVQNSPSKIEDEQRFPTRRCEQGGIEKREEEMSKEERIKIVEHEQ
jgi:hypothetical protein